MAPNEPMILAKQSLTEAERLELNGDPIGALAALQATRDQLGEMQESIIRNLGSYRGADITDAEDAQRRFDLLRKWA